MSLTGNIFYSLKCMRLESNTRIRRDGCILEKQLPEKTEYVVRFKLSPIQHEGYSALLNSGFVTQSPLVALLIFRSMCNHPKIFHEVIYITSKKKRGGGEHH